MAQGDDEAGPPGETPIQKALRLKKAAAAGKGGPPGRGRMGDERAAAARSSSKSKPWLKK
ncbi:hypothetical protein [Phenylobacterium sp.]|uniref:hypothetical protein n=1 Tax=Phenylobacterium sp. TaxID=1871053 RepID=UPI0025E9C376|nr:hypothetical protein [Phenylobacterium sp.]